MTARKGRAPRTGAGAATGEHAPGRRQPGASRSMSRGGDGRGERQGDGDRSSRLVSGKPAALPEPALPEPMIAPPHATWLETPADFDYTRTLGFLNPRTVPAMEVTRPSLYARTIWLDRGALQALGASGPGSEFSGPVTLMILPSRRPPDSTGAARTAARTGTRDSTVRAARTARGVAPCSAASTSETLTPSATAAAAATLAGLGEGRDDDGGARSIGGLTILSAPHLPDAVRRVLVTRMFDLDADLAAFTAAVSRDRVLGPLVRRQPPLRLPQVLDPFEGLVRAVLGQQVSVKAATTMVDRLVRRFGTPAPTLPLATNVGGHGAGADTAPGLGSGIGPGVQFSADVERGALARVGAGANAGARVDVGIGDSAFGGGSFGDGGDSDGRATGDSGGTGVGETPAVDGIASSLLAFPRPEAIAAATDEELRGIGLTRAKAATLARIAAAVCGGRLDCVRLRGQDPDTVQNALLALPGIGPWTASYVRMRALGDRDAFPLADLGVIKALDARGVPRDRHAIVSERWRPWRAYATLHLWESLAAPASAAADRR